MGIMMTGEKKGLRPGAIWARPGSGCCDKGLSAEKRRRLQAKDNAASERHCQSQALQMG
jgi:hypothetical protein